MDKVKDILKNGVVKARKGWLGVFGSVTPVGGFNYRELLGAIVVGFLFYMTNSDLQEWMHKIDPDGTITNNMVSAALAFVVSLLHKNAAGNSHK